MSTIYKCYTEYRKWKYNSADDSQPRRDHADIIYDKLLDGPAYKYDVLLIDEVQDFTPLELVFLLGHIANPKIGHALAVAGDTAQTITPGCSFRFERFKVRDKRVVAEMQTLLIFVMAL